MRGKCLSLSGIKIGSRPQQEINIMIGNYYHIGFIINKGMEPEKVKLNRIIITPPL